MIVGDPHDLASWVNKIEKNTPAFSAFPLSTKSLTSQAGYSTAAGGTAQTPPGRWGLGDFLRYDLRRCLKSLLHLSRRWRDPRRWRDSKQLQSQPPKGRPASPPIRQRLDFAAAACPPFQKIPPPAKPGYSLYEREMGVPRPARGGGFFCSTAATSSAQPASVPHQQTHCAFFIM